VFRFPSYFLLTITSTVYQFSFFSRLLLLIKFLFFSSQPEGVKTSGRPGSRWWECVWAGIKKGRTVDLMEISRNRNELNKNRKEANSHLVLQGHLRRIIYSSSSSCNGLLHIPEDHLQTQRCPYGTSGGKTGPDLSFPTVTLVCPC